MEEKMYYDIREFITKLEFTQFTFENVVGATEKELDQIETLKKNIIEANLAAEPVATSHILYQLNTYLDKLIQFQSELPTFLKHVDFDPDSEEINLVEKDAVLQRLKELFLLE